MGKLLTATEAAAMCRVQPSTMKAWRMKGEGPVSFRVGRTAMYDEDDVQAWLESLRTRAHERQVATP